MTYYVRLAPLYIPSEGLQSETHLKSLLIISVIPRSLTTGSQLSQNDLRRFCDALRHFRLQKFTDLGVGRDDSNPARADCPYRLVRDHDLAVGWNLDSCQARRSR